MSATCIHPRHGATPPLPADGLMLCERCLARLRTDLAAIVSLWGLLAEMVTVSNGGTAGTAAGKPGSRPPCSLDILDITDPRGAVCQQIGGWARMVIEERQLSAAPADAEQAARLLTIHADWVAAQPWADEAAQEIHDAAYAIRRACRDLEYRWTVGTCTMPGPDGDDCGGPIQVDVQHLATWSADRDDYDKRSMIRLVCRACGDTWTESDLDGYMVVNDVWLPIDDAAHQLGTSRRTLNRHAAAGRIRRRRGMVSWADAREVMQGSAS